MIRRYRLRSFAARFAGVALACGVTFASAGTAQAGGPTFVVYGRGWGHAVGMSQWGAKGLAEKGASAPRILGNFYHGVYVRQPSLPGGIRVGLLQEQSSIDVSGNGRFDFLDSTGVVRASGQNGQVWRVRPVGNRLVVSSPDGVAAFSSGVPVRLKYTAWGTLLKLPQTGRSYKRGFVDLDLNMSTGNERAILMVPFEEYLYGIAEMPSSWPTEALKAQAIAARTYAAEHIARLGQFRTVCNCAVYASTADQVYAGASQEVSSWMSAVNVTKGQAMTYQGNLIQAYYSASDGGFTENNENVWGGTPLPYLRGICDQGDYDGGANTQANWSATMDGDQMGQRLATGGFAVGTVQKVEILDPRGVSGRVLRVIDSTHGGFRITGSQGTARMSGDQFRALLGLRSTLISHNIKGDIRLRYDSLNCVPGRPYVEEYTWKDLSGSIRGSAQNFTNGRLFRNGSTRKVFWTRGPILTRYDQLRGQGIDLGLPVSDTYAITGGQRNDFERGYITWNASTGQTSYTRTR